MGGRAAPKLLDPLSQFLVLQTIKRPDFLRVDAVHLEQLHDRTAEPALGVGGCALHEHHEGVCVDGRLDLGPRVCR